MTRRSIGPTVLLAVVALPVVAQALVEPHTRRIVEIVE